MHTGFSSPAYGSAALRSARISPADSTSNVCVRLGSVSGWAGGRPRSANTTYGVIIDGRSRYLHFGQRSRTRQGMRPT